MKSVRDKDILAKDIYSVEEARGYQDLLLVGIY
jgi:hypothetical protein